MTSLERQQLASYLGIKKQNLDSLLKTDSGKSIVQQAVAEKYGQIQQIIGTAIKQFINIEDIDIGGDVISQIIQMLSNGAGAGLISIAQKMTFAIDEATGQVIATINSDSLTKNGYDKAWDSFKEGNKDYVTSELINGAEAFARSQYADQQDMRADYMNAYIASHANISGENWQQYYSKNTDALVARKSWQNGFISTDEYISQMDDSLYGAPTHDYSYYNNAAAIAGINLSPDTGTAANLSESFNAIKSYAPNSEEWLLIKPILDQLTQEIPQLNSAWQQFNKTGQISEKTFDDLSIVMGQKSVRQMYKHKKNVDDITDAYAAARKGGGSLSNQMAKLNKTYNSLYNAKWGMDQFAKGNKSQNVLKSLGIFNYDEATLKNATSEQIATMLEFMQQSLAEQMGQFEDQMNGGFLNDISEDISSYLSENEIDAKMIINADGQINLDALTGALDKTQMQILSNIAQWAGLSLHWVSDGNGGHIQVGYGSGFGSGYRGGGGGGGGGGKSKADKLITELKHQDEMHEHMIKMVQYQQSRYKNDSQLGNYGKMIEKQIELEKQFIPLLQQHLQDLKKQISTTTIASENWYKLRQQILATEEQIQKTNNSIQENTKALEQNDQAIRKLKIDLQQTVLQQIQTRDQQSRNMLSARVNMEQTILDVIKNRYQQEWNLLKQDIEKKKQALQEQMSLIDERLQRRKNAEDQAAKYEQLAKLQQQLAQIQVDPTRSKDALQLRKKIADLEKEIAWDITDNEAQAEKKQLQDQIDAYDEYESEYEQHLQKFLEDSTNFAAEVNKVLGMSHDELMKWLQNNDKTYMQSLESTQKQMKQSWEDTFKQMYGIVDTYWSQIASIIGSKDAFMEYMMQSSAYKNASKQEQEEYRYTWGKMWDDWFKAQDTSAEYEHDDPGMFGDSLLGQKGSTTSPTHWKVFFNGSQVGMCYTSEGAALARINTYAEQKVQQLIASGSPQSEARNRVNNWKNDKNKTYITSGTHANGYLHGGLVDYTGPAWVDGTPSKPEAFLSAADTALLRNMLDAAKYINVPSFMSSIGSDSFSSQTNTVGDINITLYEAKLQNNADYNEVARQIGEAFTRELSKHGMHTASYTF